MAVDTHVGDAAAGPDEVGAELECLGHAYRLDGNVRAEAAGQVHDALKGILDGVVDREVGAELERLLEPRARRVDRDDPRRA